MKKKSILFLIAATALLASSCITVPRWNVTSGTFTPSAHGYSVDLPPGWRQFETKEELAVTKDGLALQEILINHYKTEVKLAFTQKKIEAGMMPQEVAEVLMDNSRLNSNFMSLQVLENTPATVGGYPGFENVIEFQIKNGLRRKTLYYGALVDTDYYEISYSAPIRYYFAKDLDAFNHVMATFKIYHASKP